MKIITIPHPSLRVETALVTTVDKKLRDFVPALEQTLSAKRKPRGVGLAAPQVNVRSQIFTTLLTAEGTRPGEAGLPVVRTFINPIIADHSSAQTYGPSREDATLEGCLSIPGIYGPVPRWQTVTVRYQELVGDELKDRVGEFRDFEARVIQHEYDHLHGVLFIDYTLQYGLPLYQEQRRSDKLEEIDEDMIAALVKASK